MAYRTCSGACSVRRSGPNISKRAKFCTRSSFFDSAMPTVLDLADFPGGDRPVPSRSVRETECGLAICAKGPDLVGLIADKEGR